jgi:hypothetical protein
MKLFPLLLVAAMALSACSPNAPSSAGTNAPPAAASSSGGLLSHTVADEKAMYAAEAAYNVAASAYISADTRGLLSASVKAAVKPKLQAAYAALKTLRDAYALGNTSNFSALYSNAVRLANDAKALLPSSQ